MAGLPKTKKVTRFFIFIENKTNSWLNTQRGRRVFKNLHIYYKRPGFCPGARIRGAIFVLLLFIWVSNLTILKDAALGNIYSLINLFYCQEAYAQFQAGLPSSWQRSSSSSSTTASQPTTTTSNPPAAQPATPPPSPSSTPVQPTVTPAQPTAPRAPSTPPSATPLPPVSPRSSGTGGDSRSGRIEQPESTLLPQIYVPNNQQGCATCHQPQGEQRENSDMRSFLGLGSSGRGTTRSNNTGDQGQASEDRRPAIFPNMRYSYTRGEILRLDPQAASSERRSLSSPFGYDFSGERRNLGGMIIEVNGQQYRVTDATIHDCMAHPHRGDRTQEAYTLTPIFDRQNGRQIDGHDGTDNSVVKWANSQVGKAQFSNKFGIRSRRRKHDTYTGTHEPGS